MDKIRGVVRDIILALLHVFGFFCAAVMTVTLVAGAFLLTALISAAPALIVVWLVWYLFWR